MPRLGLADSEEMFQGEAPDAGEPEAVGTGAVDVVVLECAGIGEQLIVGFAIVQGR